MSPDPNLNKEIDNMWPFSKKKTKKSQKVSKEEKSRIVREEAMANMRKAREQIGEETLDKVAKAIQDMERKKKMEIVERTRRQIDKMDKAEVAGHLKSILRDE